MSVRLLPPIIFRFDVGADPSARIVRLDIAWNFVSQRTAAAIKRREDERACFALLPSEVFAADQIERHVDDGREDTTIVLLRLQFADAAIVGGIEVGERVRFAAGTCRAKEG